MLKDLIELIKAGVITQETADRIQDYYTNKNGSSANRMVVVFGILGAILVGLGIILIIAHNWDELSRATKTSIAFLPLIMAQVLCGFVLIKKQHNVAWIESAAALLFFSVGASISLVSQIYHIPGNLSSFLLTWMLLCLPIIYVMRSSMVSLLYLIGITYYAGETSYWSYPTSESYLYWLLLLMGLPYYYILLRRKPESNFTIFHHWIVSLSVIVALGTVTDSIAELMFIAYFSLFGMLYLIGGIDFFAWQKPRNNAFKILGSIGSIVLLLALSFDWFWNHLIALDLPFIEVFTAPEFFAAAIATIIAGILLYRESNNKGLSNIKPLAVVFILFIVTFLLGLWTSIAVVLINLCVFAIGILTIREGTSQDHLGILNFGLLIITALVICRFFDTDLSFVIRGTLFVSVGAGFFAANFWMLKKRKANG